MKEKIQFKGGWGIAFIPIVVFLIFCVLYFIVFKAFEMYALAMGAFVGLLIGAIFTKKGPLCEILECCLRWRARKRCRSPYCCLSSACSPH